MNNKELKEKLLLNSNNGYDCIDEATERDMEAYCQSYKEFINKGKTERLCVEYCIELAEKQGFVEFKKGMPLKPGDKV